MGEACTIIRENWQKVAQSSQKIQVLRGDVLYHLSSLQGKHFDHIYFDPPYRGSLYVPVLSVIAEGEILANSGEMAVEYSRKLWTPVEIPGLTFCREKHYGHSSLAFYQVADQN